MKHSTEFLAIVDDAKARISEISVSDALEHLANGAQLIASAKIMNGTNTPKTPRIWAAE